LKIGRVLTEILIVAAYLFWILPSLGTKWWVYLLICLTYIIVKLPKLNLPFKRQEKVDVIRNPLMEIQEALNELMGEEE